MKKIICLLIFLAYLLPALAQRDTLPVHRDVVNAVDTVKPNFTTTGKTVTGYASIYDADLDGTKTVSGEVFFNIRLTAASNDFAMNSWVKVTNPKNKKFVILRINDRLSGRVKKKGTAISLSMEGARLINFKKDNLHKVKIESIIPTDSSSFVFSRNDSLDERTDAPEKVSSVTTPNTFKPIGSSITGIASFYSYNLDGTETSTGERYRNNKLTAASNNFKLNTWVLVTNLRNKKSVIVRINDHMHPRMKKKGRVVDLSREAAKQLDFMDNGLTKVKVQPVVFVFSPAVKKELDSLQESKDSTREPDSLNREPVKEENFRTGIASFYSTDLDGTLTATGETYRNNRMSAASNDFDLNTWVRITNLNNKKSVILRINDRMHRRMQKKGRVVDLSRKAAKKLDFITNGLTKVKVEIVSRDTPE